MTEEGPLRERGRHSLSPSCREETLLKSELKEARVPGAAELHTGPELPCWLRVRGKQISIVLTSTLGSAV